MESNIIVFDCPVHGEEHQVFCFRALDKSFEKRWKRFDIVVSDNPVSEEEIKSAVKQIAGISDFILGG